MGWHTKYGGYRIDYKKVRTYVCPDIGREFPVSCDPTAPRLGSSSLANDSTRKVDALRNPRCASEERELEGWQD